MEELNVDGRITKYTLKAWSRLFRLGKGINGRIL
jgi:hypothetical protein